MRRRNVDEEAVHARRDRRRELVELILARTRDCAVATQDWSRDSLALRDTLRAEKQLANHRGGAHGGFTAAAVELRSALPKLIALGHDVEVVVLAGTVLKQLGVDLDLLFPPLEHQLPFGLTVRIEQRARAELVFTSGPDCLVAWPGHMAISIPLRLTLPSRVLEVQANAAVALRTVEPFYRYYEIKVVRRTHLCPEDVVEPYIEHRIAQAIDTALSRMVEGPLETGTIPNVGLGTPDPYAGLLGPATRLHYNLRKRSRRFVAPAPEPPDWADTTIKFAPDIVLGLIQRRVAQTGFSIERVDYVTTNVIDIHCVKREFFGERIVKIDWGVEVTIRAIARCQLQISLRRNLEASFRTIGKKIDVDVKPGIIGWVVELLTGRAIDLAETIVAGFLPAMSGRETIPLPYNSRAEVVGTAERVLLHLQTR